MSDLINTAGAASPAPQTAAPTEPTPTPAAPPESVSAMADAIRATRQEREARARESQRAKDLETKLREAETRLAAMESGGGPRFEDDPIGYVKSKKLTKEQQLFYGQSLLYDLAPDQAPPDFRVTMMEQRQRIKDQEEARQRQEFEAQRAQEAQYQQVNGYVQELDQAVTSFKPGSFPESEVWFGEDRNIWVQSMFATANNLAEVAAAQGQVADLSAANVARVLEAEVARKMAERDRRAASRKGADPIGSGVQSAGTEAMSTRNMTGSGAPTPPATTEEERIRRAAEVAFRPR
jgi:hypothetical protein